MNEIMHPIAGMRDQNLKLNSSGSFLHGCPEVSAARSRVENS